MSLKNKQILKLFLSSLNNGTEKKLFDFKSEEEKYGILNTLKHYVNNGNIAFENIPDYVFKILLDKVTYIPNEFKFNIGKEIISHNINEDENVDNELAVYSSDELMDSNFFKQLVSYKQNIIINLLKNQDYKTANEYIKKYITFPKHIAVLDNQKINILLNKKILIKSKTSDNYHLQEI